MGELSDAAYKILPVKWFLDFFKNLRFRWKLFLSYIIVVIIPLSVLGVYSYDQAKNFLTAETRLWMNESATQITEKINSKFTRYNSMMDYIVYNSQFVRIVNDVDSSYYQQYLDFGQTISPIFITVTNLLDELDALKIYTDNENLLVRADYFSNIADVHSEPWYGKIAGKINAYWNVKDNKIMD